METKATKPAPSSRRLRILMAISVVVVFVGIYLIRGMPPLAANALLYADSFELLSLYPSHIEFDEYLGTNVKVKGEYHGYKVLGRTPISDAAVRRRLYDALQSGVWWSHPFPPMCFNPRHGIRVIKDGKVTDFLICFECEQVQVFWQDQDATGFHTTSYPAATFDDVLREAGVVLAPKSH